MFWCTAQLELMKVLLTLVSICAQDSVHQQTMRAISRLETKTYNSQGCSGSQHHRATWGSASSSNSSPVCAICLEEFQDGQVSGWGAYRTCRMDSYLCHPPK